MTLAVYEEDDGSFTIEWDENDPVESVFNTWAEQDFIDAILEKAKEFLDEEEPKTSPSSLKKKNYE